MFHEISLTDSHLLIFWVSATMGLCMAQMSTFKCAFRCCKYTHMNYVSALLSSDPTQCQKQKLFVTN